MLQNILERLNNGELIIGEGGYVFTLEKRGVVRAGDWTPEAASEYPETVKQLALEYARAGADVTQTYTYSSTDDRLTKFRETFKHTVSSRKHISRLKLTLIQFLSQVSADK